MSEFTNRFNKKKKIIIAVTAAIISLAVIFTACGIYLADYYKADTSAIEAFNTINAVSTEESDGFITFKPESATKGFIFYPGGKVEHTAYIPLMQSIAQQGILCVLVEMPFNLAVFDINAADGIAEKYPEIEDWYIGGHSLGGAMAASYIGKNTDNFKGLVLLGAYSTADLSESDLDVLSIYGSQDLVMNRDKYAKNKSNLPDNFKEIILEGGCHSYFGMYGSQKGDGKPTISNKEQIFQTAKHISDMINK